MEINKQIASSAILLIAAGIIQYRYKNSDKITSTISPDLEKKQNLEFIEEKLFGGLTENEINNIATKTPRGLAAFLNNGMVKFKFSSSSNKQILEATFEIVSDEVVNTFVSGPYGNQPNAPKFFQEMIIEEINRKKNQ
ncbi:hypothetical protein [Exiguobacterium chiriqhucha]|uniref:Uncharacterized protein n=1 Tax=Exiguobacterium chiriqhucha RW-2 TaxID=1345023 RepID=U1N205_9BACL|nr:hypothetical protein [Exiguobacterium chiriqhucha]ERG68011.1 hypothetical protein M467_12040 [Exiguobacterium chiriqhucha RW-2]